MLVSSRWQSFIGKTLDEKYRLRSVLGEGSFGGVLLADEVIDEQVIGQVAVKFIRPHPNMTPKKQRDELVLARQLDHPHVLRCFNVGVVKMRDTPMFYMVMEKADESLQTRLQQGPLSPEEVKTLAGQLVSALVYLHGGNPALIHRDIKPANILRVGDRWTLADFGVTRTLDEGSVLENTTAGTPLYMPPEAFSNQRVSTTASDIWAFGLMLLESFTGNHPYRDADEHPIYLIMNVNPEIPDTIPNFFRNVISGCLKKDRTERISAQEILDGLQGRPVRDYTGLSALGMDICLHAYPATRRADILDIIQRVVGVDFLAAERLAEKLPARLFRAKTQVEAEFIQRQFLEVDAKVTLEAPKDDDEPHMDFDKLMAQASLRRRGKELKEAAELLKRAEPVAKTKHQQSRWHYEWVRLMMARYSNFASLASKAEREEAFTHISEACRVRSEAGLADDPEMMRLHDSLLELTTTEPERREPEPDGPAGKSRVLAGVLGMLFGGLGLHRFYLGYTIIGVIQVVVTLITLYMYGFGALWGMIEGVLILFGKVITEDSLGDPLE